MTFEILVGEPPRRIVTKSGLLGYYDRELGGRASAAVPLGRLDGSLALLSPRAGALAAFIAEFADLWREHGPAAGEGCAVAAGQLLETSARLSFPWTLAKEASRTTKRLARRHGLMFYAVSSEEWLNAARPTEEHRAGEVFTCERGKATYLACNDALRLTDPDWFSEEAYFCFALRPDLTMQAHSLTDHYAVECRLGAAENTFRAVTMRLADVRAALDHFYNGNARVFSVLDFVRVGT